MVGLGPGVPSRLLGRLCSLLATGFGFNSLEGFLAARLMTEALQRAGADPSREQLLKAFGSIGQLDLGGFRIGLGPNDRNASDLVELTYLGSQRWEP